MLIGSGAGFWFPRSGTRLLRVLIADPGSDRLWASRLGTQIPVQTPNHMHQTPRTGPNPVITTLFHIQTTPGGALYLRGEIALFCSEMNELARRPRRDCVFNCESSSNIPLEQRLETGERAGRVKRRRQSLEIQDISLHYLSG